MSLRDEASMGRKGSYDFEEEPLQPVNINRLNSVGEVVPPPPKNDSQHSLLNGLERSSMRNPGMERSMRNPGMERSSMHNSGIDPSCHTINEVPSMSIRSSRRRLSERPITAQRGFASVSVILCLAIIFLCIVLLTPVVYYVFLKTATSAELEGENTFDRWPDEKLGTMLQPAIFEKYMLPEQMSLCKGMGFSCAGQPSFIIGLNQLCDGHPDCPDGSDESNCKRCATTFHCPSSNNRTLLCLRGSALCDGVQQCNDGSDEAKYCRSQCRTGEVQCPGSRMCVPTNMVCDGDSHCRDDFDEMNCDGKCKNGAVWCASRKRCVAPFKRCDGIKDCPDGSDEAECTCRDCASTSVALCPVDDDAGKGMCMLRSQICDGVKDCPDGQDEMRCPGSCSLTGEPLIYSGETVKCADNKEYPLAYACSGLVKECDGFCKSCVEEVAFNCGEKCISRQKVCDGAVDCKNGKDESDCECRSTSFRCPTKAGANFVKCIAKNRICDGFPDCAHGEDELNCKTCNGGGFHCVTDKKCIPNTQVCDGVNHCKDGTDEINCTCETCERNPEPMYMCEKSSNCIRRDQACGPYSTCQEPTTADKVYCAAKRKPITFF